MDLLTNLEVFFTKPENTSAGCNFCDIPIPVTFDMANVAILGAPIDITTTFGKTTSLGPYAIRTTSTKQIETFIYEKNIEIFKKALIYDLGDIKSEDSKFAKIKDLDRISSFWNDFDEKISNILDILTISNKLPVILGGEHTITYPIFKKLSKDKPLLLHFDAHRDMKSIYEGMTMCHTTPFFHLIENGYLKGENLVQLGIRQGDANENQFALRNEVTTFDAWDCNNNLDRVKIWLRENTRNRKIYVSFDIDVYDISYLPCTGTPEPYGLNPFQILDLINSIDSSARLVGVDFVETGFKNNDFREGAIATQTLLRILGSTFMPPLK
ncbi:arginase family protein [Candidatus Nitrosocosmicus hydrocola]|uniref:arginase family protein n=1 Tax=Candidatus Nitrosocosmicus hydrocola TaxID=1826872 RepID=UPI0011E5E347|nr:arginase family protein [Candidatus Nitrosocosmicus hydrocola]